MNLLKFWLGILCSSVLMYVALIFPALCWLTFAMFVPALFVLQNQNLKMYLLGSFALFFTAFFAQYNWVYYVVHNFGDLSLALSYLTVALFALINAPQGMLGFVLFRYLKNRINLPTSILFVLAVGAVWNIFPTLFPWDLAVMLSPMRTFIQGIDIFGSFGIDCLILFANYALYICLSERRLNYSLIASLALCAATLAYGSFRTEQLTQQIDNADKTRIALIQPNLDSGNKADPRFITDSLRTLVELSRSSAKSNPQLIVWPESVFPIDIDHDSRLLDNLLELTSEWNSHLLFGGTSYKPHPTKEWEVFNTANLISKDLPIKQSYQKHVLLAFGEYIPLESMFPAIRYWLPNRIGSFGRGIGPQIFKAGTFSFGPIICYESIIDWYIRTYAKLPVTMLVEITNDGWYGKTPALLHHKNLTALRAMENRLGIARDTNTGITLYIDPLGREFGELAIEASGISNIEAANVRPYSFYTHFGYLFKLIVICITGVLTVVAFIKSRTSKYDYI